MDQTVDKAINKFVKLANEIVPVSMAILYGSYARGTENEWSDIDVAIITDNIAGSIIDAEYNLTKLRRDIDDRIEPVLFCGTRDKSGFLDSILSYGKIIYKSGQ